jgi:uncharacterized membrane protein (DUF441 family)
MNLGDLALSYVRTLVPIGVGFLVSWAALAGVNVDESQQTMLISLLTSVITGAYYVVVRWAETRWPKIGWLLGSPKVPVYNPPTEG